ncbi:hypothetical protein ACFVHI_18930 [Kitasatospora sp. NPDC127121]|uniref:hypothetical protein n=1 Tax=Kitasatospora sp. NPDC127121 TaxID=3345371 RepID=UPI0036453468
MPVDLFKTTTVDQSFAAIVADVPDLDIAADDEFACEDCGGKLEAAAPLWFNVRRRPDGTPVLDVYSVGIESSTVSCDDCGRAAGVRLHRLITDAMCPFNAALRGMEV